MKYNTNYVLNYRQLSLKKKLKTHRIRISIDVLDISCHLASVITKTHKKTHLSGLYCLDTINYRLYIWTKIELFLNYRDTFLLLEILLVPVLMYLVSILYELSLYSRT